MMLLSAVAMTVLSLLSASPSLDSSRANCLYIVLPCPLMFLSNSLLQHHTVKIVD